MPSVHDEILLLFREGHSKFSRFFTRVLTAAGVSLPQYALLNLLVSRKTLKMTEISRSLFITKPAVTNLVDRLEAEGFLRRVPHPKDRRVHLLEILPKGQRLVRAIQSQALAICEETIKKLNDREAGSLLRFYKILHQAIDAALAKARNRR